jgi:DNA-binding MarR family transcriptional regulator
MGGGSDPSDMSATELAHKRTAAETDADFDLPTGIDSTGSKLVYLYLDAVEAATIEELQESLGMKQLALFPVLDTLAGEGLVERHGDTYAAA